MVRPIRIERMTLGLGVPCSVLLSYGRMPLQFTQSAVQLQAISYSDAEGIVGTLVFL